MHCTSLEERWEFEWHFLFTLLDSTNYWKFTASCKFIIFSVIHEFAVFRHYCTVMVLDKFTMSRHALMLESHSGPSRIVNPKKQNMHLLQLKWNPNHQSINLQSMSFSLVLTSVCSYTQSQREGGREREMIHLCGLVMLAQLHLERGQSTKKRKRRLVSLLKSVLKQQQQQFIQFCKINNWGLFYPQ